MDESWAVAQVGGGRVDRRLLLGAGLMLYVGLGRRDDASASSAEACSATRRRYGLDAAFPALFLALLIQQLDSRRALVAALVGAGLALVLVPFSSPGVPIIAATAACLVGLWRR